MVVIILSVAFNKKEYNSIKNISNLHLISFSLFFNSEFSLDVNDIYIKIISVKEWFDLVLKSSQNDEIKRMYKLSELKMRN